MKKHLYNLLTACLLVWTTLPLTAAANTPEPQRQTVGVEIETVPYFFGGYHGSLFYGYEHWRVRGVIVNATLDIGLSNGFEKNKLLVGAAIFDYFFQPEWRGWFLSSGFEYASGNISNKNVPGSADYKLWLFTAGAGYAWKFMGNLYIAPHVAFALRVAGDKTVSIQGVSQDTPLIQPEAGLRIGWHF